MNTTIIINCSDDMHILSTLNSIDEDVEVICSITPNTEIEQILIDKGIPYVVTPKGNHSITTNAGIALARFPKLILMDSDCTFAPGAIRKISKALDDYLVVNALIKFEHNGTWLSQKIAECRSFDNQWDTPAYKPGLGLHVDLLKRVGSWFNPLVSWPVDAELSYRIKRAKIEICHLDSICLYHAPISIHHNLRASFHYGMGDYIRVHHLGQKNDLSFLQYEYTRYKALLRLKGFSTFCIMLLHDLWYHTGYLSMSLKDR